MPNFEYRPTANPPFDPYIKTIQEKGSSVVSSATAKAKGAAGQPAPSTADADELREKIEAARQRIAAQVMENAEQSKGAAPEVVAAQ